RSRELRVRHQRFLVSNGPKCVDPVCLGHVYVTPVVRGRRTLNIAPPCAGQSTVSVPPCACRYRECGREVSRRLFAQLTTLVTREHSSRSLHLSLCAHSR